MPGVNRTTEDGRPMLIDGSYDFAHNIHGTLATSTPDSLAADRQYADVRAKQAFLNYIKGRWTLDIDATAAASGDMLAGVPKAPITLDMAADGTFKVSAPQISVAPLGIQIDLGVEATGQIELDVEWENDVLAYTAKVTAIDVQHSHISLAGMGLGELLGDMIEGLVLQYKEPQDIKLRKGQNPETLELGDMVTHVLKRVRPALSIKKLPIPKLVGQGQRDICWAAAISSFLLTTLLANKPKPDGIIHPIDSYPALEVDAVIATMRSKETPTRKYIGPGDSLLVDKADPLKAYTFALSVFGIAPPVVFDKTLDIFDIKDRIDAGNYILMAFRDPGWDRDGKEYWHDVIAFGYDESLDKIFIMDPNGPTLRALYIEPDFTYYLMPRQAQDWPGP